jgi:Big-like domain-containing protein/IPT/TIG domain-containing protein
MSTLKRRARSRTNTRRSRIVMFVLAIVCFSLVGGLSAGLFRSSYIRVSPSSAVNPPPPPLPSPSLQKEYIYAGSKLIATEEPTNAPPTVIITNPAPNAVFTAPANITIDATATDIDGTISKVEFYQNNALLSTDTAAPFSFPWNSVAAGSYSLTAKAYDNNNAVTASSAVAITVNNALPVVSITSPANNTVFTAPADITINASASDPDGTISKVEFYQGTTLLNTDTVAPYSYTWPGVGGGVYSLTAKAYDNSNGVTTSSAVTVIVNSRPTVSISNPANNTVFNAPANITIDAAAGDSDGSISKVEFYQGTTLLNTDTAAPYSYTWPSVGAGSYSLTAKAYDNNNATATSAVVNVVVNALPAVSITSPTNNQQFSPPANIVINATASDSDGTISKVEFYQGTTLLNTDTVAPYSYTWPSVGQGTYVLTAKAYDNNNGATTSSPVTVSVGNALPVVSITSPASNTVFNAPASITINATASDPDGTISKVEFYQGTTLLNTDTAAPYSYTWPSVSAGTYSLTAKATDNSNGVSTSSAVTVIVNAPPTVSITNPSNNTVFTAPANITIDAAASDSDGTISKVEFYQGATLLNTDTTAPYSYNWPSVAAGTYSLTAKAYDNNNATTVSGAITVISNAAPAVSITTPSNNAIFTPPANITINATASDSDGTISAVEFYQGSTLIGTDTTSPYSVTWNNVVAGSYLLTARATDNRGAITTSGLVAVTAPTFYDDFNDNSLDLAKWFIQTPGSAATVTEQSQQLRITLPTNVATYNGVGSNATYDMRGGTAQVELVQSVSQAGFVENFMTVQLDAQNYLMIQTGAGNLLMRSMVNGANDQLSVPYDAVAHRFWRIRHSLGTNTVSFETSPDGAVWTSRKTVTAGFSLTSVRFNLFAGAYATGNPTPGAAIYNDFQFIADPSSGTPPPIFSDDFNDNSLDTTKWDPNNLFSGFVDTSVPISEMNQRFEIGPLFTNVSGSHYRGIRSVNTYNLTDAYAYVELVQAPSVATAADAMFTVGKDVDNYYRLYVSAGNLFGQRKIGGTKTTLFTIPYEPTNHRFLRIRDTSGNVSLDTAPSNNGAPGAWVQRYTETWNTSVTLTAIIFEMKGGTSSVETNLPGKVIFDNFAYGANSAPPPSAPTVTGIAPSSGPTTGGTSVTITGTGFQAGATVKLGGTLATNITISSSTSISATTPAHSAGVVDVQVTNTDNQSGTLTSGFTYTSVPSETVLLADDFDDNSLDTAKWDANNLFSGFTDTNVPVAETSQRFEIGALFQNVDTSHYHGLRSVNTYNFTGAYCYVELVQAASASTAADAMLTVGKDVDNYYRIYVEAGNLIGQRKIGGVKTPLFTIPYDSVNHRFLRIRHNAGSVTLDTAPGSSGTPGTWVQRYSEIWSSSVGLTSIILEMKGGTWQIETNAPGKVIFDNFRAAVPNP